MLISIDGLGDRLQYAYRDAHKKQFIGLASKLGVDVLPALEQARLDLNWLDEMEPPEDFMDVLMACGDPLVVYWESLSALFEAGVKGMLLPIQQPEP